MKRNNYLGVIGLGYVGLPLAIEFTNKKQVIAFDVDKNRINQLIRNIDNTGEISKNKLSKIKNISFTYKIKDLEKCNTYIITVPTPINKNNKPDLKFIKDAGIMIGKILKKDDLVILESTVYPGLTEEFLIPLLPGGGEVIHGGLDLGKAFFLLSQLLLDPLFCFRAPLVFYVKVLECHRWFSSAIWMAPSDLRVAS